MEREIRQETIYFLVTRNGLCKREDSYKICGWNVTEFLKASQEFMKHSYCSCS
jgi:hypothetical protein